jgi:hypothetical protein
MSLEQRLDESTVNNLYLPALLIHAILWLSGILLLHFVIKSQVITLGITTFFIIEFIQKIYLVKEAKKNDIYLVQLSDLVSESFSKNIPIKKRIYFYLCLHGTLLLLGVTLFYLGQYFYNESLRISGALFMGCCLLKLIPLYPTEGGNYLMEIIKFTSPNTQILIRHVSILFLAGLVAITISPLIGLFILIPFVIIPQDFNLIRLKIIAINRIENAILQAKNKLTDQEICSLIIASPEVQQCSLEEQQLLTEDIRNDLEIDPLINQERKILGITYSSMLILSIIVGTTVTSNTLLSSEQHITNLISENRCNEAREAYQFNASFLESIDNESNLSKLVNSCGIIKDKPQLVIPTLRVDNKLVEGLSI